MKHRIITSIPWSNYLNILRAFFKYVSVQLLKTFIIFIIPTHTFRFTIFYYLPQSNLNSEKKFYINISILALRALFYLVPYYL